MNHNVINKKDTLKFFKCLASICSKKAMDPIFTNFRITFTSTTTTWFATDSEVSYIFIDKNKNNSIEGEFLIDAKVFANFLKKSKANEIGIYKENTALIVFDEDNKVSLKIFAGALPTKDVNSFKPVGELNCALVQSIIECGRLNVNENNDGKFFLKLMNNNLTFAVRDNRRLTVSSAECVFSQSMNIGLRLIVIEQILEFTLSYEKIEIFENGYEYMISSNNEHIIFKTLPKDSIDCAAMCNHDQYKIFKCKTKNIKNSVNFAGILQSKFNSTVHLTLNNNNLVIEISDPKLGKYTSNVNGIGDATGSINLKIDYLYDALHLCQSEDIEIFYKNSSSKFIIQSMQNDVNTTHVIMPIILSER